MKIDDPARENPSPGAKRVVLVASHAPSLTIFRAPLIRTLVGQGHAVLCLAPDFTDAVASEVAALGAETGDYPLERTGRNPLRDMATLRALVRAFRVWKPDVVMGYTPKPAIYGALAARIAGVPRIVPMVTGLGYAFLPDAGAKVRLVRRLTARLYALAFRASHSAIFHNKDDLAHLRSFGVVPAGLPVHVVSGSGVDVAAFPELPLPPIGDGLTFLMIARLVKYKGIAEFCAAAREVKEAAPGTRFVLVGPEESGPAGFSAQALEAWRDCVTYLGPLADVRPSLAQCHVYVLPSYGEGMPRTVLEAMACGRPVITTDARGCRETVDERVNGCLVPVGDARALAQAMLSFLRRPDLIPAMARASRQKAVRRFDVALVNQDMIAILLEPPAGRVPRLSARNIDSPSRFSSNSPRTDSSPVQHSPSSHGPASRPFPRPRPPEAA